MTMLKIPLLDAISEKSWFRATRESNEDDKFKFRIITFDKILPIEIDEIHRLGPCTNIENGDLWVLKLELENESSSDLYAGIHFLVIDHDDYMFTENRDAHFTRYSEFAKNSSLNEFGGPYVGSISGGAKCIFVLAYYLPKENTTYHLGLKDWDLQGV